VPEADDIAKSDTAARDVEGGDWHLEVEDNQGKLLVGQNGEEKRK
jgi:hypothetical protein